MDKVEFRLFSFIFIGLIILGAFLFKEGDVKKDLIYEKTGKEVSWFTAISYPNEYFINADIKLQK